MALPPKTLFSSPFFSVNIWKQRVVFGAGAILVGALMVLLTLLNEWSAQIFRQLYYDSEWIIFILCPVGLGLTSWLTFRFFPGTERSGVPQVKMALEVTGDLAARSKFVSLKIALSKIVLLTSGLFSGASLGLDGPAVQIGASTMTSLGRAGRFPPHYLERGLILAGGAAGFAAIFSAPLTGIVFAIEEMGRTLEEKVSPLVLTAIIFAGITAHALLGTYLFFQDCALTLPENQSWIAVPVCGIVAGFLGGLFSTIIINAGNVLKKIKRTYSVMIALLCGAAIAVIGHFSAGTTFGTGYQVMKDILFVPEEMNPLFPFLKILATLATFLSGIPAGLFVPSLAAGAGLGVNLSEWLPFAPATAVILLTMTAYFAGMLQSPYTAFVIVIEMTSAHGIIIPLMATAFIATATSKIVCPKPLYSALCEIPQGGRSLHQ